METNYTEKLNSINKLISDNKLNEALKELEEVERVKPQLRISDTIKMQLLKSNVMFELGKFEESLQISESLLNNSQQLENSIQMLDAVFIKAKSLSRLGEYGKSLAYIKMGEKIIAKLPDKNIEGINERKAILYHEKGNIFEKEADLKNALENYLQSLSIRRDINDRLGLTESNNRIASIYFKTGDIVRALVIFQQSLSVLRELGHDKAVAETLNQIGKIYLWRCEYGPALENCLQGLALGKETGNAKVIASVLDTISEIYTRLGELDRALEYLEESISLQEDISDQAGVAESLIHMSFILIIKGQLNQATSFLTQAQEIYKELKDKEGYFNVIEVTSLILYQRGEFKQAIEHLNDCLQYRKDLMNKQEITRLLFWLIIISIESNELKDAQKYLKKLQKLIERESSPICNIEYRLASALILKKSNNKEILEKARSILSDIEKKEPIDFLFSNITLYNFCELLLKQMQLSNKKDDIDKVNDLIEMHLSIAKQIESHIMFAENFWLKANLSLIQGSKSTAKIFIEQAEQITEDKGLRRLGLKITRAKEIISNGKSPEFQPLSIQEEIISSEEDSKINGDVVRMIDRRTVEIPKLQEEEPVLLIIVYEGGVTVFSKKFSQKEMIDEMFVGGFLTAIDAFMHQTFATGGSIERIQHQEYTLLLKVENPLLFCYVFKGQSFTAIQKLDKIIQELKKSETIWNSLVTNHGEQLTEAERSLLDDLADQVFLLEEEEK
ncbi:MAG: tetratricopeptide repeat protein [Asgard group archaeon]|nr:tetratricopeptide repeat protein [Asgard group archaeon]